MDGHSPHSQASPTMVKEEKVYPSILSRPSSSDACATIVQGLMMFNQSPDEEFSRKACESLVKKMKDKRDELDALIVSVYSQGEDAKKCITIARTLDGRLQVAGRKGFPHVVYAKIFRWPDLHKNELKHLPLCENAFDLKADNVCVNPFHYERVVNAGMGTIEVKADEEEIHIPEQTENRTTTNFYPLNQIKPGNASLQQLPPLQMSGRPQQPNKMISPSAQGPGNRFVNFNSQMVPPHMSGLLMNQQQQNQTSQIAHGSRPHMMDINSSQHSQTRPPQRIQPSPGAVPSSSRQQAPIQQAPGPMGPEPILQYLPPQRKPMSAVNTPSHKNVPRPIGAPPIESFENAPEYEVEHALCENATKYQSIDNLMFSRRNIVCVNSGEPPDPPLDQLQDWVTMVYYERKTPIFTYTAAKSTIYIDSGFSSAANRWCLGGLFRDGILRLDSDEILRLIGRGLRMSCKPNGDIWIQNFSHNPIFFQSYFLDRESGREAGDVVHKVYPGTRLKIYDSEKCHLIMKEQWLSNLMNRCRMVAQSALEDDIQLGESCVDEAGNRIDDGKPKEPNDDPLADLLRFCLARIAFIEGWGPDYDSRTTIDECHYWIEIKLNEAFVFLDRLLTEAANDMPALRRTGPSFPQRVD